MELSRIVTVKMKFPIDQWPRSEVDRETERLRHCVIPIVGDDGGRPYVVGSAVAVAYRGIKWLATAHHVLEDNQGGSLFFVAADDLAQPFGGTFQVHELHDLAVKTLDNAEAAALSHIQFLTEADLGEPSVVGAQFYGSVAGYPATAAKRHDKITLETPMEITSGFATAGTDGTVSVRFDKKEGAYGALGHTLPRDQYGKSGGAIFGMRIRNRDVRRFSRQNLWGSRHDGRKSSAASSAPGLRCWRRFLKAQSIGKSKRRLRRPLLFSSRALQPFVRKTLTCRW